METVPHRQLRNESSDILRRVAAGETIAVTNHGQVAAVMIPPPGTVLERLVASGNVRLARRPASFSDIPRARGIRSDEVLADLRGDR